MKLNCTFIYVKRPLVAALTIGAVCATIISVTSMVTKAKIGTKIFVIGKKPDTNEEESEEKE